MNSFIEMLNNFAASLLSTAWQMFWQSGLLIIVIFAVDFLLRRKIRASVRYALWLVALVKLLLPPTLALPTGLAWWIRPGDAPPAAVQAREVVITYPDNVTPFHRPIIPATFVPPTPHLSVQAWIFIFATATSAALLAWLLIRWIQISRTVRQADEPGDSIPAVLEEARAIISLNSRVCARITKEAMSPAVCGLFGPMILLPESLAKNLSANQLRAVLVHELVHIKRRDVWMNCLQTLLQIGYWWHPLVWIANSRIRRVREEAVDDAVMLALRDEADCYAPTLLEVAKLAFHRPLASLGLVGILESRGALRQRIERLIDFKTPRRTGLSFVSILGVAAFTAVAVPMGVTPPPSSTTPKAPSDLMASPNEPRTRLNAPAVASVAGILTDPQFKTVIKTLQQRDNLDDFINGTAATFPVASVNNFRITWLESKANGIETRPVVETGEKPEHNFRPIQLAQNSIGLGTQPSQAVTPISPLDGVLAFDKELKEATVNPGEAEAKFKFNLTNVSSFDVTITNIFTSCGCTVAKMPSSPWLLAPGATGEIPVTMNLAGKSGVLTKTVSVNSEKGTKVLTVKATIRPAEGTAAAPVINTSPGRKAIMQKLDQIKLENVSFNSVPLSNVVRMLSQEARLRDPEKRGIGFIINPQGANAPTPAFIDPAAGLPIAPFPNADAVDINSIPITINPPLSNVRMADVLDAIVKSSDRSIKYSIQDYAVVFFLKPANEPPPLVTRKFIVDPRTFVQRLKSVTGFDLADFQRMTTGSTLTKTNFDPHVHTAFIDFFLSQGVNLNSPKSVFFNDNRGELLVRATAEDLDIIEAAIQTLNLAPPQINVRVKFIELDENIANALSLLWNQTNHSQTAAAPSAILTVSAMKDLMKALQNRVGVTELSDGNVTTLSGRQAQIQMVEKKDFITTDPQTGSLRTNTVPCGPVLDVIPFVSADGYTIQMNVTPSLTEFLGYDDPQKILPNGMKSPLPHFRVRQMTTSAIVWDGQTVVLSRLPQTDVVTSNGTTSTNATAEDQKRNLFVLITPTLIDPAGNRIHSHEQIDSLPATRR